MRGQTDSPACRLDRPRLCMLLDEFPVVKTDCSIPQSSQPCRQESHDAPFVSGMNTRAIPSAYRIPSGSLGTFTAFWHLRTSSLTGTDHGGLPVPGQTLSQRLASRVTLRQARSSSPERTQSAGHAWRSQVSRLTSACPSRRPPVHDSPATTAPPSPLAREAGNPHPKMTGSHICLRQTSPQSAVEQGYARRPRVVVGGRVVIRSVGIYDRGECAPIWRSHE
jgi:hypothetical protein